MERDSSNVVIDSKTELTSSSSHRTKKVEKRLAKSYGFGKSSETRPKTPPKDPQAAFAVSRKASSRSLLVSSDPHENEEDSVESAFPSRTAETASESSTLTEDEGNKAESQLEDPFESAFFEDDQELYFPPDPGGHFFSEVQSTKTPLRGMENQGSSHNAKPSEGGKKSRKPPHKTEEETGNQGDANDESSRNKARKPRPPGHESKRKEGENNDSKDDTVRRRKPKEDEDKRRKPKPRSDEDDDKRRKPKSRSNEDEDKRRKPKSRSDEDDVSVRDQKSKPRPRDDDNASVRSSRKVRPPRTDDDNSSVKPSRNPRPQDDDDDNASVKSSSRNDNASVRSSVSRRHARKSGTGDDNSLSRSSHRNPRPQGPPVTGSKMRAPRVLNDSEDDLTDSASESSNPRIRPSPEKSSQNPIDLPRRTPASRRSSNGDDSASVVSRRRRTTKPMHRRKLGGDDSSVGSSGLSRSRHEGGRRENPNSRNLRKKQSQDDKDNDDDSSISSSDAKSQVQDDDGGDSSISSQGNRGQVSGIDASGHGEKEAKRKAATGAESRKKLASRMRAAVSMRSILPSKLRDQDSDDDYKSSASSHRGSDRDQLSSRPRLDDNQPSESDKKEGGKKLVSRMRAAVSMRMLIPSQPSKLRDQDGDNDFKSSASSHRASGKDQLSSRPRLNDNQLLGVSGGVGDMGHSKKEGSDMGHSKKEGGKKLVSRMRAAVSMRLLLPSRDGTDSHALLNESMASLSPMVTKKVPMDFNSMLQKASSRRLLVEPDDEEDNVNDVKSQNVSKFARLMMGRVKNPK
jgi:hypothetical protein